MLLCSRWGQGSELEEYGAGRGLHSLRKKGCQPEKDGVMEPEPKEMTQVAL